MLPAGFGAGSDEHVRHASIGIGADAKLDGGFGQDIKVEAGALDCIDRPCVDAGVGRAGGDTGWGSPSMSKGLSSGEPGAARLSLSP